MNFFEPYNWQRMLNEHPAVMFDIKKYFELLCPPADWPQFLDRYLELPVLKRLSGIGLLCGTDWTKLYKNRFYYSRLDHSKGVALIIWHFTHDKAQTIAGLLHDIATPVFSHVSDFRKGDALTQTATEAPTSRIIRTDKELCQLLAEDDLTPEQVEDYHIYPVADNEIPQLSADRLEYMFPSGAALDGSWTLNEISFCYNNLTILKNENKKDELGFKSLEAAELYCKKFCMIGHILQLNENKLALHLLGQIMNLAEKEGILTEEDFMTLSEKEVMKRLDSTLVSTGSNTVLTRLYKTFRTMTSIEHTSNSLDEKEYFCVSLKVKQRYINPLVAQNSVNNSDSKSACTTAKRLSEVSKELKGVIEDFLAYSDTAYGCVKLV